MCPPQPATHAAVAHVAWCAWRCNVSAGGSGPLPQPRLRLLGPAPRQRPLLGVRSPPTCTLSRHWRGPRGPSRRRALLTGLGQAPIWFQVCCAGGQLALRVRILAVCLLALCPACSHAGHLGGPVDYAVMSALAAQLVLPNASGAVVGQPAWGSPPAWPAGAGDTHAVAPGAGAGHAPLAGPVPSAFSPHPSLGLPPACVCSPRLMRSAGCISPVSTSHSYQQQPTLQTSPIGPKQPSPRQRQA